MNLFPMFLKLQDRRCLVVGAGRIALEKIETLLNAGALIRVVAPRTCTVVESLAEQGRITLERRPFTETDLAGNSLVVTATDSREVNHAVFLLAAARGLLCNSVDDPPNCDFYFASTVQRGPLQVAISTAGESPALAQRLRREIEAALPHEISEWVAELGSLRREVLAERRCGDQRKALLHRLAHLPLCTAQACPARQMARAGEGTQ